MTPAEWVAVWMTAKPIKRFNEWRRKRKGKRMALDLGTRTSTNAGVAGFVAILIMQGLKAFVPDFAPPEGFEASITAIVMWVIARFSKSPTEQTLL